MTLSSKVSLWKIVAPLMIVLSACGGNSEPPAETETPEQPVIAEEPVVPALPSAKLNLNTASEEDFRTIPGVGDRMVHEFLEYRPYVSIQQFRREIGKYVDENQVAAYEEYVFVPVDPNESDAATLEQLPGVDADEAAELVAGRPYASREAFLEKLRGFGSDEEVGVGETYLTTP